jgi:hypothetical protein
MRELLNSWDLEVPVMLLRAASFYSVHVMNVKAELQSCLPASNAD